MSIVYTQNGHTRGVLAQKAVNEAGAMAAVRSSGKTDPGSKKQASQSGKRVIYDTTKSNTLG